MGASATRSHEGHYATYREDILSGITPQIESLSLESIYSQYYFDHGRVSSTEGTELPRTFHLTLSFAATV